MSDEWNCPLCTALLNKLGDVVGAPSLELYSCPECNSSWILINIEGKTRILICIKESGEITNANKPQLNVEIASASCFSHNRDFIYKDGHYYCPDCFPEGFAVIDKNDLEFFVACKTYKETRVGVCPSCGNRN